MKTVLYLSLFSNDSNKIRKVVENATAYVGARFVTIENIEAGASVHYELKKLIRNADLVIANLSNSLPVTSYEVGLAHGLGKQVWMLSRAESKDPLPYILGIQPIEYSISTRGLELLDYQLTQSLKEFFEKTQVTEQSKSSKDDSGFNRPDYNIDFQTILTKTGIERIRLFERWFFVMADGLKSWEILATSTDTRGFDAVLWNSSHDSDLVSLGNPIPVEIKATKIIQINTVAAACQMAQMQRHRGLILATTAKSSDSLEEFARSVFLSQGFTVAILGEQVLREVRTSDDLLRAIRDCLRKLTHGV